ncbi:MULTISPECIES: HAD-IA family hydrolase [unclassified Polaribacter]|uniref:HAD-IA family hydrolase n=1 Tax=unclassified Polaribacter TaxID=196858 RepID=UPI0011BEA125|nr:MULTISPECIES: HAD-IA family hydrolase [unclassified Polaribacter]TXD50517.1 HAD-IA family hydrolase [Polaribacter sp. IC063]TXD59040.1 HAD-IA family hydrolase [Polaribacter sp. IC066]
MIKNIIFDFGDIFINLDKQGTYKAMAALGVSEISDEMIQVYHHYEKGLMSTDDFIKFFHDRFHIPKTALIAAWNSILLDFPARRLEFLKEISASKKYRLFLLSNTNDLHIKWVQNSLGEKFYNEFKSCFEQFYLSHEINFRKPDAEIYEFVLNKNSLVADETLFVDDLKENTDAANKLGIHVWNLIPGKEDVITLFTKNKFL